jgi:hypothetical protein
MTNRSGMTDRCDQQVWCDQQRGKQSHVMNRAVSPIGWCDQQRRVTNRGGHQLNWCSRCGLIQWWLCVAQQGSQSLQLGLFLGRGKRAPWVKSDARPLAS